MRYKNVYFLSELKCAQERSFAKWIENLIKEVDGIVRDKLSMDKYSLESQKRYLRSLVKLYKPIKKLRKTNSQYDLVIKVTNQGYVEYDVYFPYSLKEMEAARENRRKAIDELNQDGFKFGSACVRIDEELFKVLKPRIEKEFPMLEESSLHLHINMRRDF